ncbi:MAG: lamin tail domain-containing protein [Flavobacteriales bacterium]|jgi:hypothetical protein|nr:lamin tail domain-containing protein [Flavobacteriales bacterium]
MKLYNYILNFILAWYFLTAYSIQAQEILSYDSLYRLKTENIGNIIVDHHYDKNGNETTYSVGGVTNIQDVVITEIMSDPSGDDDLKWQWIEVYNKSSDSIDLSGFLLSTCSGKDFYGGNILKGIIHPVSSVILFNADSMQQTQFDSVWNNTIPSIAVSPWPGVSQIDTVALWRYYEDYQKNDLNHALSYVPVGISGFPMFNNQSSFYLSNIDSSEISPNNWSLSLICDSTPVHKSLYSKETFGNIGLDIGSPNPSFIIANPSVELNAEPTVCEQDTIVFFADVQYAGSNPEFQWLLPTGNWITTSVPVLKIPVLQYSTAPQIVLVKMISNHVCVSVDTVFSAPKSYMIYPKHEFYFSYSICQGDSFELANGDYIYTTGTYTTKLLNEQGCDSVIHEFIDVLPLNHIHVYSNICQGESYQRPLGDIETSSGTYFDTLQSQNTCDSLIVETILTVYQTQFTLVDTHICSTDSFQLASGGSYTNSGIYTDSLLNSQGCDSVVIYDLSVYPVYHNYLSASICDNQFYILPNGDTAIASGIYTNTFETSEGCDSLIEINLTVFPTYYSTFFDTICQGNTYVLPNGNTVSATGTYTSNLNSINICDSIIITNLEVLPEYNYSQSIEICLGDTFISPAGQLITQSGVWIDTLETSIGSCDSIWTNYVVVNDTFYSNFSVEICQGEDYLLPNGVSVSNSGEYINSFSSIHNCDSTIVVQLIVHPAYEYIVTDTLCHGEVYIRPNGIPVSNTGIYYDTLLTVDNCDSIIISDILVNPTFMFSETIEICDDQMYILHSGDTVSTSGLYIDTFSTTNSCDSIYIQEISVFPTYSYSLFDTICQGDNFLLPDSTQVAQPGIYTSVLSTKQGCDSIINTFLHVKPISTFSQVYYVCQGDSVVLPNGNWTGQAGIYIDTLENHFLCDSIIETEIIIEFEKFSSQKVNLCHDQVYTLISGEIVSQTGLYIDTTTTFLGCDSIVHIAITKYDVKRKDTTVYLCGNETFLSVKGQVLSESGFYSDTVFYSNMCEKEIYNYEINAETIDSVLVITNNKIEATQDADSYQWISCADSSVIIEETGSTFYPNENGSYSVIIIKGHCSITTSCKTMFVENFFDTGLIYYKNPVKDYLTIELGKVFPIIEMTCSSNQGRLMREAIEYNQHTVEFDFQGLPPGLYLLEVKSGNYMEVLKIIKE